MHAHVREHYSYCIWRAMYIECISCYEYKFCSNCDVFLLREKVIFIDVLFNLCIITQSTKQQCLVRCGYLFFVIFS